MLFYVLANMCRSSVKLSNMLSNKLCHCKNQHTVDREKFVIKKVTWDKSSTRFNFVKAESIVCTSTEELYC